MELCGNENLRLWSDDVRELPHQALPDALIGKAYEVVAGMEEGVRRETIELHLSFLFDPEAAIEYTRQREAEGMVKEAQAWLEAGAPDLDTRSTFENPQDTVLPYMEELGRRRAVSRLAALEKVVSVMEFGVSFGERPDGGPWLSHDTYEGALEVAALHKELGMPVKGDKLRELIKYGLNERYDGVAIPLLLEIAGQAEDRVAFQEAGERYRRMLENEQDVSGLPGKILDVAPKFIGGPFDRRSLDIALEALGGLDPNGLRFPFDCVRLALAVQGLQQKDR